MVRRSRLTKAKNRRERGTFAAIPHSVLKSPNYAKLSFKAVKLLLDLAGLIVFKRNGETTNGNLCAALKPMKLLGWKSSDTLDAAEAELLHYGFIEITQRGNRRNPTLYAVTWEAVASFDDKPWIHPTTVPSGKWKQEVETLPPRRRQPKKLIPDVWVTPCPRIGSTDSNVTTLYPTIGLKWPDLASDYARGLGTSIALPEVSSKMPLKQSSVAGLAERTSTCQENHSPPCLDKTAN